MFQIFIIAQDVEEVSEKNILYKEKQLCIVGQNLKATLLATNTFLCAKILLAHNVILPPTVAPTMAIANSSGMLGREYPGSHSSAKQLGGITSMTALLVTNAFPKQEDTASCKEIRVV